jgi:hypothetical protein
MKVINHTLSKDFKELQILPLADLHLGDIHSDGKKIQEWIEYIKTTPNCYTILNGDLMDSAIKSSIGDIYGANLQPMMQLEQAVKIFGCISDKILAVTPGNHEARIYKSDGLDITQIMCSQLGIGERYSSASVLLIIRFGKTASHEHGRPVCYTIFQVHGSGGGRLEGGKINRLMQLASIVDADIYIRNEAFNSDSGKFNGTEYMNRISDIPVFFFSYHNFEDFLALHYDGETFQEWKRCVLMAPTESSSLPHHDSPLPRSEYAPLFQKVFPRYSKKKKVPFDLSVERLSNLRRNLKDPDVQTMSQLLQPGVVFGEHLLQLFDEAYPGLIP